MSAWKLFYAFQDPLGAPDSKIGISGHWTIRQGVYQNSYSRNSHVACFNKVYIGPASAINNLEKAVKQHFNWDIERDGRGASEWISGMTPDDIESKIDEIITGYQFKVTKVDSKFLPLTVDKQQEFEEAYPEVVNKE
jgi:hypothetical protein